MPAKVFGVASVTGLTGFTGAVLNDVTTACDSETKELRGNPSSVIADVRTMANAKTMNVVVAFESMVDPADLIGDTLTVTVTSESATTTTIAGKVTSAEARGVKDDWWTYSITIRAS